MRNILDETHIHPAIRERIAKNQADIVQETQAAISANKIVIVGMKQNPFRRKAMRALDSRKIPYQYLEYGSYFSQWRRRTALKMWTGWPTFPMIFVKGIFVGGANDLIRLLESGEIEKMLLD